MVKECPVGLEPLAGAIIGKKTLKICENMWCGKTVKIPFDPY